MPLDLLEQRGKASRTRVQVFFLLGSIGRVQVLDPLGSIGTYETYDSMSLAFPWLRDLGVQ